MSVTGWYLYLNGVAGRDLLVAAFSPAGRVVRQRRFVSGTRTERLLPRLAQFLAASGGALNGIVVAQGEGSFSQSRLICSVANALAYAHGVPLTAMASSCSVEEAAQGLCRRQAWRNILLPHYYGPAVE